MAFDDDDDDAAVDLYWLPLGAGGQSVRLNGRAFEAVVSRVERRPAFDLYHSALEVRLAETRFVIEMAPVTDAHGDQRGVVADGSVGTRWAGRFRIFRYEVRSWRGGSIPDIAEAVVSPRRLSADRAFAHRLLDLTRHVPTPVWGRDELKTGDMWNSNSVTAWLVARSGIDAAPIQPPTAGRAPGWRAGLVVAARQEAGAGASQPAFRAALHALVARPRRGSRAPPVPRNRTRGSSTCSGPPLRQSSACFVSGTTSTARWP